jgi:hypothetical protein
MLDLGFSATQLSALHDDAIQWDDEAITAGIPVDNNRTVGSIAQTDSGVGHVAVVESINADGTITITESSYSTSLSSTWNFLWRHRTISPTLSWKFIHVSKATSVQTMPLMPENFSLDQNYPNPFNPTTNIRYGLPCRSLVRLEIFNALGQRIQELVNSEQDSGFREVIWHAMVPSGCYFYRIVVISVDDPGKRFSETRKLIVLK